MARPRHKITLQGYHQALSKAKSIEEYVKLIAAAALYSEGQKILAASKSRVPVVTGELLNSAYISPPVLYPSGSSVEIGYTADHAVKTHFNPKAGETHGISPGPRFERYRAGTWASRGSWMFLQGPAMELSPTSAARMAEEMSQRLRAFVSGLPR